MSLEIAIVNETGGHLDARDVARLAEAAAMAVPAFCATWDLDNIVVAQAADEASAPAGAPPFRLTWADPGAPAGALGWHDEQEGMPYAEIPVDVVLQNGGGILDGGTVGVSVLSVLLHELWELAIDAPVDDWVLMPTGVFLAKEVSDPVQMVPFPVQLADGTVCLGSDYVTPAYFDAQALDGRVPLDAAHTLQRPFALDPGGYQIQFDPSLLSDPGGPIVNVFGASVPGWVRTWKQTRERSRTRRRRDRGWKRIARRLGRKLSPGTGWPTR